VTNFTLLSGGEVLSKIFTFFAFAYLARVLSPNNFGYLEFTLAVMVFLTLFVDFGTSPFGAREVAKNRERIEILVFNIIALRLIFALLGYLLLLAFIFLQPNKDKNLQVLLLIYGLSLFANPGFLQWIYQGLDKMKWVALGSVIRQMVFTIGVFVLIRRAEQLWIVAVIEFVAVCSLVIFNVSIFRSKIGKLRPSLNLRAMISSLGQAYPIGLSELTWAFTWYFPIIFLGLLIRGESVGWFGAAFRPVMTLHMFVWLYFYNLLPTLSRCSKQPQEILKNLMDNSLRIAAWSGIFLGTAGTILARPIITIIFGPEYTESVSTFMVLIWMIPLALLSGHYHYALIAYNQQKYEFISYACGAVVGMGVGILLIPRYSTLGAGFSLLTAGLISWIMAYVFVQRKICRIPFSLHIFRPVTAGIIMYAGFYFLKPLNVWLASVSSIVIFISILFFFQPGIMRFVAQLETYIRTNTIFRQRQ
jgi:O-antigen/teichoic acid export membrane protein